MRSLRHSSFLLSLALLTSCTTQSTAAGLTQELSSVSSWAATAHMVGDAWRRSAVPTNYAKQTLHKAQQELQTETDKLAKVAQQQKTLLENIKRLNRTVSQMSAAVEQQDRTAITQQIQQLSIQEQAIAIAGKNIK